MPRGDSLRVHLVIPGATVRPSPALPKTRLCLWPPPRRPPPKPGRRLRACRVLRWRRKPPSRGRRRLERSPLHATIGATPIATTGDMDIIAPPIGSRFRSTGRISTAAGPTGTGYPGCSISDAGVKLRFLEGTAGRRSTQIQLWNIISRLKVAIDVPTKAAEIGSITAKPANPTATKAHNSQRGLLPRLSAYTSARLATVADGK